MEEHSKILYDWLCQIQLPNGLVPSYEFAEFRSEELGTEVSTYDNSLAVIEFCRRGDFHRAERILDFFNGRIDSELKAGTGGLSQFRYATSGEPRDKARWMGDVSWLLLALQFYRQNRPGTIYDRLHDELNSWLHAIQDHDGALFAGFNAEGNLRQEKVVEGMLDAFVAVPGFAEFHRRLLTYLHTQRWNDTDSMFIAWEGSEWEYAMDTVSWGFCALPGMPKTFLSGADRFLVTQKTTYTGTQVTGFCFDGDLDTIWIEGTGEMAVAYAVAGWEKQYQETIGEMEKMFIASPSYEGLYGLPYVTNCNATHYGPWPLGKETDKSPWVAATVWYLFAKDRFNPFLPGLEKEIPVGENPFSQR